MLHEKPPSEAGLVFILLQEARFKGLHASFVQTLDLVTIDFLRTNGKTSWDIVHLGFVTQFLLKVFCKMRWFPCNYRVLLLILFNRINQDISINTSHITLLFLTEKKICHKWFSRHSFNGHLYKCVSKIMLISNYGCSYSALKVLHIDL